MDAAKKRIPEQCLASLLLELGYVERQEIEDCLKLQKTLAENGVEKSLEEILAENKILLASKSRAVLCFIEFIKIRWQGIAIFRLGVQKQKLKPEDLAFVLMTQRSIYLLKNKAVPLEDLIVRMDILSERQRENLTSLVKELSLTEYEELLEESFQDLIKEDAEAQRWRRHRAEPPPARLEQPPPARKSKPKRHFESDAESKPTLPPEKGPSTGELPEKGALDKEALDEGTLDEGSFDEGEYLTFAPPSKLEDIYDIDRTEPFKKPERSSRHRLSPPMIAALLSILITLLVGALGTGWIFKKKNAEIKAANMIREAMRDREYRTAEKYCREFRQAYPGSPHYEEITRYLQVTLLTDVAILYRQGISQKAPEKFKEAQSIIPKVLELNENTEEAQKARAYLKEIERNLHLLDRTRSYEERCKKIDRLIAQNQWEGAEVELKQLEQWVLSFKDEKFLENTEKFLKTSHRVVERGKTQDLKKTYRYYPARELPQKVNSLPEDRLPSDISLTLLHLGDKDSQPIRLASTVTSTGKGTERPFASEEGHFFMVAGGYLIALKAASGKISWVEYVGESRLFYPIFIAGSREYYNMKLVDSVLIVVPFRNSLQLLEASTGEIKWEKALPSVICVQPVLCQDKIYVGCLDHYCYELELSTGSLKGAYKLAGRPNDPPVFDRDGEAVYFHCENKIYGYSLSSGELSLTLEVPNMLAAPVLAISPYLYLFTSEYNRTFVYPYLLTKEGPALLKKEPYEIPGIMRTSANHALGMLAVATDSHLAVFDIHGATPYGVPISLNGKGPAFMRFSNTPNPLGDNPLLSRLLVVQENLSVFQRIASEGKTGFEQILSYSNGSGVENLNAFMPIEECGSLFFWAQVAPSGRYVGTCVKLEAGKCIVVWQIKLGIGTRTDLIKTSDGRLLAMDSEGSIYEIKSLPEVSCRLLVEKVADGETTPLLIHEKNERLLVGGSRLQILDTQGKKKKWEPKLPIQGKLGRATSQSEIIFLGTSKGVFAISSKTGEECYEEFAQWPYKPFAGTPVFYQNSVLIGCDDGQLYQLALTSGNPPYLRKAWTFSTGGPLRSSPLLVKDALFFTSHDLWHRQAGGALSASCQCLLKDVLFFGSHDHCYAINLKTHEELWQFPTRGPVEGRPMLYEGVLYFGSDDRHVYAVSAQTGQMLWKQRLSGAVKSSPLVHRGKLYTASVAGDFCVYDLTGKRLYQIPVGGRILSSPVISGDRVFLASSNGFIYCVKE